MFTAILLALAVFLAILAAFYVGFWYAKRAIRSAIEEYREIFHGFIDPPGENQQSPLAVIIDSLALQAGHTIAVELKTTLMNRASVAARQEAGIVNDLAQDQLDQTSPLIAGLLDQSPRLKKRLMKNPQLIDAVMGLVSGRGSPGGSLGSNGPGSRPKFKL